MAKQQLDSSALQQLKQDIRTKTLAQLYVFYGEEVFLLRHYLEQLRRAVVDELTESFNFHFINSETFDVRTLADAVENLPMMADRTMVQVDDIDLFKLPEDSREKLAEILSDIPEYCTVVFTYETVAWHPESRMKHLFDAVSSGRIVEFVKQNQRDLIVWITRHFAAQGKQISPELCSYLIDITDGTMTSLYGEIKKISAYSGADTICRADIDAVTEPVLDAVIYRMTDHLGEGNYGQALLTLQQLLKMQEEPVVILGAVGNHFRRLAAARTLLDSGKGVQELTKLYKMKEYPAKKAMQSCRKFSAAFYALAAQLILETDRQMKTSFDDAQRLLEILLLRLSVEAKNG